jgi:prevent-host-death family protein
MKALSVSEAKMKLSGLVETVHNTDEEIMITKNGHPAAILISPDEFDSFKETIAIRSDKELINEIKHGMFALKRKETKLYTLKDLFE